MKHKTAIPGDQPDADSGSRNRELSAAKGTYASSKAMDRWFADDKRRTNAGKENRALLVSDMRNANSGRRV